MNSSIGRSYHASAPCSSNTDAARSTSAAVRIASPHVVQSTAGIGTPQARWREMHQSGRFASMLKIRSRPHAGIHLTSPIDGLEAGLPQRAALGAAGAVRRRTLDERLAVHADEPLRRRQEDHRVVAAPAVRIRMRESPAGARASPRSLSASSTLGFASKTLLAAEELDRVEEMAAGADRRVDVEPVAHAR